MIQVTQKIYTIDTVFKNALIFKAVSKYFQRPLAIFDVVIKTLY